MNDAMMVFSASQAITTTVISTNVFDLNVYRDIGKEDLFIHLDVAVAFSSDTETVEAYLVGATATATAGSTATLQILEATAASALTKGFKRVVSIPRTALLSYDHIGVVYVATTAVATGKVNCYINMNKA